MRLANSPSDSAILVKTIFLLQEKCIPNKDRKFAMTTIAVMLERIPSALLVEVEHENTVSLHSAVRHILLLRG
jgi:hypothetical protein